MRPRIRAFFLFVLLIGLSPEAFPMSTGTPKIPVHLLNANMITHKTVIKLAGRLRTLVAEHPEMLSKVRQILMTNGEIAAKGTDAAMVVNLLGLPNVNLLGLDSHILPQAIQRMAANTLISLSELAPRSTATEAEREQVIQEFVTDYLMRAGNLERDFTPDVLFQPRAFKSKEELQAVVEVYNTIKPESATMYEVEVRRMLLERGVSVESMARQITYWEAQGASAVLATRQDMQDFPIMEKVSDLKTAFEKATSDSERVALCLEILYVVEKLLLPHSEGTDLHFQWTGRAYPQRLLQYVRSAVELVRPIIEDSKFLSEAKGEEASHVTLTPHQDAVRLFDKLTRYIGTLN